jgi:hypothetical protein
MDPVVVQEKVDGSQISFCVDDEGLHFRSKSKQFDPGEQDRMFDILVESVEGKASLMVPGWIYRGEYLRKKKHNTLVYDRVPEGHVVLFDIEVGEQKFVPWVALESYARDLGLEPVPRLYEGRVESFDQLEKLLETQSFLGGTPVEGVVVKNYTRYGRDGKSLMGKFVSEKFKERHTKNWKLRNPSGSDIRFMIGHELQTEARWEKAIQHLRDRGELLNAPQDIGPLMREVNVDVLEEERETIMEALFKWAWRDISRAITRGLPEWYKERLARSQFDE